MSGPGTGSGILTSDFEELLRAELIRALAEPDQTVEEKQHIATHDKELNELQGALKEKELQEDGLRGMYISKHFIHNWTAKLGRGPLKQARRFSPCFTGNIMLANSQIFAGHWEDELNGYLTDMSSKFEKRSTPPPSPGATYKAWKAKAQRRHRRYRYLSNNNPYSNLDCPWPFCSESFPTEDAVFDHYRAHHPFYIDDPGSKKPLQCPFCLKQRYGLKSLKLMRGHQNRQHRSNRWAQTGEGAERDAQEALAGQTGMLVEGEEFQAYGRGVGVGVKIKLEDGLGFE
jgi:hypothetical protein